MMSLVETYASLIIVSAFLTATAAAAEAAIASVRAIGLYQRKHSHALTSGTYPRELFYQPVKIVHQALGKNYTIFLYC